MTVIEKRAKGLKLKDEKIYHTCFFKFFYLFSF